MGLADALSNAGRGAEAAPHYLAAARIAGPLRALDLRRRGAEELLRSGRLDEGRAVAAEAMAAAGLGFSRSPVRSLLWQRVVLRSRGLRFRRRTAEEIAPRELARIDLCWSLSSGLGLMDPMQGAHFQSRSLVLALRSGEPYRVARGIAGEAAYAAAQGDKRRAQALLAEAGADRRRARAPPRQRDRVAHERPRRAPRRRVRVPRWRTSGRRSASFASAAWARPGSSTPSATSRSSACYYLGQLSGFRTATVEGLKEASDRGSVYATTTLRTGLANAIWLLRDEPDQAREDAREAMRGWSAHGYHIQHWYELIAQTQIDLYHGDGAAAHARVTAGWRALRRSNLLRMQHTRIVATHLRGRAALAAAIDAGSAARGPLLDLCRRCAARIEGDGRGWGSALGALLQAGIERVLGQPQRGRAVAAPGHRRDRRPGARALSGRRRDGCGGGAGAGAGERWMSENGVRAPRSLARMLVPGVVGPD